MLNKPFVVVALLIAVFAAICYPVAACNTPVYRYAMYNWQTAPYIVFYFHEGEVAEEDKAVNEAIEKLSAEWPPEANVRLEPIDVSDEKKMEALPEFVIEAWKSHEGGKLPAHVIFSPWRGDIYTGHLDTESVKRLVDSPARQKLGRLLEGGDAAVMILLTCPDAEQNKKAEQALQELCKLADAGEIPVELQLPPMGIPGQDDEEAADQANPNKLGISVLKVDRNDPAEEFFVRMLMTIEEDLQEYADQPMIFAGYGRGRAMEPYIGKGITTENLVDVVAFLAGACSCMVKDQNPGADLLVKWNWEATADKMAENDPSLDYGPYGPQGYGEYPAESDMAEDGAAEESTEVATDGDSTPGTEASEPGSSEASAEDVVAMSAAKPVADGAGPETSSAKDDAAEVEAKASDEPSDAAVPKAEAFAASAESASAPEPGSFASRRMLTYGLGFGAVAIGVLLAGLALVLRRS